MQRSSSSSATLRTAGSTLSTSQAHIPKRAVQHGVFLPSFEVLPTDLKPGQRSLVRQLYQEEARGAGETFLAPDRPHDSIYGKEVSKLLSPEAYKDPTKKLNPQEAPDGQGHHKVAHWKSSSHAMHDHSAVAGAVYHRQHGPPYQVANPPTCVGHGQMFTSYHEFHGKYGSNPRDRLHPHLDKMPIIKSALHEGTHKGTAHIPGYQGFLASNTSNPHVARMAGGAEQRSVDKTNLTQQFHTNLLNYSGHVPLHARNDNGGVRTIGETTMSRSFSVPRICAA